MTTRQSLLSTLKQTIVVSVQATGTEPLNTPEILTAMACSALNGGAGGLRLAQASNLKAFRALAPNQYKDSFLIGITKPDPLPADPLNAVFITPTISELDAIAPHCQMVATDATHRIRPDGNPLAAWVQHARKAWPETLLMADVSTLEEGLAADALGFDCVGTTLAGYTAHSLARQNPKSQKSDQAIQPVQPDFLLLEALVQQCQCPVILEGNVWTPAHVSQAFLMGAFTVVIGSAITRPQLITQRFLQACPSQPVELPQ
ncbi:MAG: N-acetylmannosamine-6-phosphate 2-epimerase [Cyanobacteria bacterium P01_H01_bin.74]